MVLQMRKGILDSEKADVTFPTTLTKVQTEMRGLEEFGKSYGVVRSVSGEGPAQLLNGRVQVDDLNTDRGAAVRWFTLAAEQGNQHAQYFLDHMNDVPSLFASATQLLHHMGRVFQEQAPPPSGGVTFVDSKLRQRIREKKIAMGHKPDDHEEQTQQLR